MTSMKKMHTRAESDARAHGYYLHPDPAVLHDLLDGLKRNEERYGYPSCPCRLASGAFEVDRDIICPCDYRDPDVQEFGYCYCALYVRKDAYDGETPIAPIPERRPSAKQARTYDVAAETSTDKPVNATVTASLKNTLNLWYCKQCGYVCFREDPPYLCPICKAKKEMFTPLSITIRG